MHKIKSITAAALMIAAIGLTPAPSSATVILNVDATGQLTGAMNVNVGGTLFDVTFVDGTCIALFSGCDSLTDFDFTAHLSVIAARALRDQVFIDVPNSYQFDSDPSLVTGCEDTIQCGIFIPYRLLSFAHLQAAVFLNFRLGVDDVGPSSSFARARDFHFEPASTFARFTRSAPAAIPEPGTLLLYLVGLAVLAGFTRRRRA